jgi:hypothetical protein
MHSIQKKPDSSATVRFIIEDTASITMLVDAGVAVCAYQQQSRQT